MKWEADKFLRAGTINLVPSRELREIRTIGDNYVPLRVGTIGDNHV